MLGILRNIIFSILSILCLGVTPGLCAEVVMSEDVLGQARSVERVFGEFLQASLPLRFKYEFGGELAGTDEGDGLVNLCEKAQAELEAIHAVQEVLENRIEEYEGRDWDVLYGQSRLWQRINADLQRSAVLRQRLEIYKSIGLLRMQRRDVLARVIAGCESKDAGFGRANGNILEARAVVALGGDSAKRKALEILDSLGKRDEIGERLYFEAELIKLHLAPDLNAIERLAEEIAGSKCRDDFELNLGVTVIELKYAKADRGVRVGKMLAKWPGVGGVLGEAILEQLYDLDRAGELDIDLLENRSGVEISLVLGAVQRAGAGKYRKVIEKICAIEKFRMPLALYAFAEANVEDEPAVAIRYYLKAAIDKSKVRGDDSIPGAVEIAEFAARLAYKLYYEDSNYLETARLAMGFYCTAADKDADEEIVYLYAGLLGESGMGVESRELLEKISAGSGQFAEEAKLDLIAEMIEEGSGDAQRKVVALKELEGMISGGESARVTKEALKLYCRVLLEGDDAAAVKVLELLEGVSGELDGDISLLRGVALYKLGRFVEAVEVMANGAEAMSCQAAGQVYVLLEKVLEQMDIYASQMSGFAAFGAKCEKLARVCVGCAEVEWRGQVELLWAEIAVFAGDDREASEVLDRLKEDMGESRGWIRCRARLSMEQEQWGQAFEDWGRIRRGQEKKVHSSDSWWRAKYYELYCFVKMSSQNKAKVAHAVEILEASEGGISGFWGKRLVELKKAAAGP